MPNHLIGSPQGGMTVYYIPGYPPYQKVTAFKKVRFSYVDTHVFIGFFVLGVQNGHWRCYEPQQVTF